MGGVFRAIGRFLLNIIEEKLGRVICIAAGIAIIAGSFDQAANRNSFAIVAVLCGTMLLAIGCLVDRIAKLVLGLQGVEVQLHPPRTAEETSAVAAAVEEDPGLVRGVEIDADDVDDAARYQLADASVKRVLIPDATSILAGCELHLYLYDDLLDRLLPTFEPDEEQSEGWPPGKGAVGFAWVEQALIFATAPQTYDETFGLTPDQQSRYHDLTAVAALPVVNAAGQTIAVLAASSTDPEQQLTTDDGLLDLEARAAGVARILVDLLQWFDDAE